MELLKRTPVTLSLSLKTKSGSVTSVRNHVKIYPWRAIKTRRECYLDSSHLPYTDRRNVNEFSPTNSKRKDWQRVIPKNRDNRFNAFKWNENYRSDPVEAKNLANSKMQSFRDSLQNRGSARETTPYSPPADVHDKIISMLKSGMLGAVDSANEMTDEELLQVDLNKSRPLKKSLMIACIDQFNHHVPASSLNDIETVEHLIEYFSTPVRGINSYDSLQRQEANLPENLTLIPEPMRWDRKNDDFFGGYNALPGTVSKIPGLRGAKKYPILNQDEFQWPDI